jgi:hypothetical protein
LGIFCHWPRGQWLQRSGDTVPCRMARVITTHYRDTSLTRNTPTLGLYSRTIRRVYGGPRGWEFLMSDVPL